jgi:hypothetical protein
MRIFKHLPERMRSIEFLNSISPDHKFFASYLQSEYGSLVAANYVRLNYGTDEEKPISQRKPQDGRHEVTESEQVLTIARTSERQYFLLLDGNPVKLPSEGLRLDCKFIAIAYRSDRPIGFSLSRQGELAKKRLRDKHPVGARISVHPIVFCWVG